METNWPWNWRLTVLKTIMMTLSSPPVTDFKMTIRADCADSACRPLLPSLKALAHWLSVGSRGVSLWTGICPPPTPLVVGLQNKANFTFHHPCFFPGFWASSRWTFAFGYTRIHFFLQRCVKHVFLSQLVGPSLQGPSEPDAQNTLPALPLEICHGYE